MKGIQEIRGPSLSDLRAVEELGEVVVVRTDLAHKLTDYTFHKDGGFTYHGPGRVAFQAAATQTRRQPAQAARMRRGARRRGAGRPRAQAVRSSVASGDSGDPDEHRPARTTARWRAERRAS